MNFQSLRYRRLFSLNQWNIFLVKRSSTSFRSNFRIIYSSNCYDFLKFSSKYKPQHISTGKTFSSEATLMYLKENETKLTFQQLMTLRKKQAQRSVMIQLDSREHTPFAISACENYGIVQNAFICGGESQNVFLLLEFSNEDSVSKLLSNCHSRHMLDAFTIFSRIVHFDKISDSAVPNVTVTVNEDATDIEKSRGRSVSELIEDIYTSEKLSELNIRLRFFLCCLIKDSLSGVFPHCNVYPFGSSVNGIGRHGCDLDMMLQLCSPSAKEQQNSQFSFLNKTCVGNIRELQKRSVFALGDFLRTFLPGISRMNKIPHARVPILKFTHNYLGIECDISINNMSAVLMSEILYFLGEVDSRVRPLIYVIKKWAKEAEITYEAPGTWITNFALTLLVIFFLQNRPVPILPSLQSSISIEGDESSPNFFIQYKTPLEELQAQSSLNKEPLALLLKEFLAYLASQPFEDKHISIMTGVATQMPTKCAIWVQYPMEEDKNVTKNVANGELYDMCRKAHVSFKYLNSNLYYNGNQISDIFLVLGISAIKKQFSNRNKKIDAALLMDEHNRNRGKTFSKQAL